MVLRSLLNNPVLKLISFLWLFLLIPFAPSNLSLAQDVDFEYVLDTATATIPLPVIFKPAVDLSG